MRYTTHTGNPETWQPSEVHKREIKECDEMRSRLRHIGCGITLSKLSTYGVQILMKNEYVPAREHRTMSLRIRAISLVISM